MGKPTREKKRNPKYFGEDWTDGREAQTTGKKQQIQEKKWEIDDIMERRGEEVLVKWKGEEWVGHTSWVCLDYNPELAAYLALNSSNPHTSSLARQAYSAAQADTTMPEDLDLQVLRQEVFEALGEPRPTPDGDVGFQHRMSVTVPFSHESFQRHFRHLPGIPDTGNVPGVYFHIDSILPILGENICRRPARNSSSEMRVNPYFKVRISWEFKRMVRYDHSNCSSCSWTGPEEQRPGDCQPKVMPMASQPKLTIVFSRMMINTLACT